MVASKLACVAFVGVAGLATAGQAAVISTDSVVRFSSQLQGLDNRNAENISNDSFDNDGGNNPDAGPGHTNVPFNAMWLTTVPGFGGTDNDPYVVIDLGGVFSLASFQVWNYNEASGLSRGVEDVAILISSTTSDDADFVLAGNYTFQQAPGTDGYVGEVITFPFAARYIKLDITSNYGGDGYGLSEIQFNAIPEPASVGLLAAGGLLMLTRRRGA